MKIKFRVERLTFRGFCLAAVLLVSTVTFAQSDFDAANTAYAEGRYEEAATIYQALLDE